MNSLALKRKIAEKQATLSSHSKSMNACQQENNIWELKAGDSQTNLLNNEGTLKNRPEQIYAMF